MSVTGYFRISLDKARRILRETELGVSEIAHQCGFYDHSAFTRAFRRWSGTTPAQWRLSRRAANRKFLGPAG